MGRVFYSPGKRGFYSERVHGAVEVDDGEARVRNPKTTIPEDAVEVTPERRTELMEAQGTGKVIVPGPDGHPIAEDAPGLTPEQAKARRDMKLRTSVWRIAEDEPAESRIAWLAYRQALRAIDLNTPAAIQWPVAPAA